MKLTRCAGVLSAALVFALLASCGKKERTAKIEKQVPKATPPATPIPHTYKLGEPKPIVLNVDKPLIVSVATPTPDPTPKRGR